MESKTTPAKHIEPSDRLQKIGRACCDPLWIQHRFLRDGHNIAIDNGTATFIKFRNCIFICTCRHVADAATGDLVPALMVDKTILNIASHRPDGTYRHNFRFPDRDTLDIAIAPMTAFHWSLFQDRKGKVAIDLDAWEEPDWPTEGTLGAVGYFNEEKHDVADQVATPMGFVTAELASSIGPGYPSFTLSSLLEDAHGHFFSGMSGGPAFLPVSQQDMLPVGIVFEGGPSSGRYVAPPSSIGPNDIFVRAHTLTPAIFEGWLAAVDLLPPE